jgi:erythromycin esterase-like protein
MDVVGDAQFILIGEASHGTHEFYRERARITQQLIEDHGFAAVCAEADWPDAYRVNRYVQLQGDDATAVDALGDFNRFPSWMWRNTDVVDFVGWLRSYNESQPVGRRVGFYGLDLYSLHASMNAVVTFLDRIDPDAARRARARYACFEHFATDAQAYGYAASSGLSASCEDQVVEQLLELHQRTAEYASRDGRLLEDDIFYAEQNARLAINAEEYYRSMFRGRASSWNLRDRHMADTIEALRGHLSSRFTQPRLVGWAHNSHIGDARATSMHEEGELNVGQLARDRYGGAARLVGFTTHTGTVSAARDWDGPVERRHVRPALRGSYELLFHEADMPRFLLLLAGSQELAALQEPHLERAIGVVYRPETERISHYFSTRLPHQFDAVIHIDETRAVEPLERNAAWETGELPETFPYAV